MERPYRLGLDLGTNSIGWAALTLGPDNRPNGVLDLGVRIYSDGRNPKDGSSLAAARRAPRGMRHRRDRYLRRRSDLIKDLITVGLMPPNEAERQALADLDPYELRAAAAHRTISPHELGRALFHLAQRRGFKSNRKTDNESDNKLTARIDALQAKISASGSATLGEFLNRRRRRGKMVRARPESGFYPVRALYEAEFDKIRAVQEKAHTLRADQWDTLRYIIFRQRDLKAVDPGWCLLEEAQRRAHRALPCAQEFRMVQEVNNLRILHSGRPAQHLTPEQRDTVLRALRTTKEVKFDSLAKMLKLSPGDRINLLDESRPALKGDETSARLSTKPAFGTRWHALSMETRTAIVRTLLDVSDTEQVTTIACSKWGLDPAAAKVVAATKLPDGYVRLSEKAILRLLPVMEGKGLNYAEAVADVPEYLHHSDFRPDSSLPRLPYYGEVLTRHVVSADPTKPREDKVAHFGRIANPTVHIGLGQVQRLVNRLIDIYGKPAEIVVELARDLKRNKKEREAERKKNKENWDANDRRRKDIEAAGRKPTPYMLQKLRLREEQRHGAALVCPFTLRPICFEMAISEKTQIEHILPFSKTLDNSMANKVLALQSANQVKGDRSPYEAFHTNPQTKDMHFNYAAILQFADALPVNKRWRFLPDAMQRFQDEAAFLDRQLNETRYLSRITREYLAHLYNERAEGRRRVHAIPGRLTALLRRKWGLSKLLDNRSESDNDGAKRKNRNNHKHHAIDAFVVAMMDQCLLNAISRENSDPERNRLIESVPEPWPGFSRDDLRQSLARLIVSHRPDHGSPGKNHGTTGSLHNDTAYGLVAPAKDGKWTVVSRCGLASLQSPEDMDKGLAKVRDHALREALTAAWRDFKTAPPSRPIATEIDEAGAKAKTKNPAALFAEHVATHGVLLNGKHTKVRRVRLLEDLAVVPIADRRTGNNPRTGAPYRSPYKAYKPDGNAFGEIYRLPDGTHCAVVVRRFDANQPGFDMATLRPHPAARKLMRLHIDDMVGVEEGGRRRILRVVKMSGQTITLAEHDEAGALKKRHDDRNDPFRYLEKSAGKLVGMGLRKVGVDEAGRLSDPGPRLLRNAP